ncbi:hypothetical protein CEUSTIGMA_g10056.t1 [Chlamydomonas eustigma]|uniref:Rab-GAP TBC domain-containing protein n=1 Tax=Chlamydomonas eustigma TaxID=1157962 RepID=A0A250XIL7_9CHLO|nr:hypothetical protein CEUSTIGMA_g10056.t1 [Chlamydomonas eustigma]|eukprot:GAX82630.1 hypothetical protein CEUSTIGMA_g10056.t1 [Chlamydomonas eustigma]
MSDVSVSSTQGSSRTPVQEQKGPVSELGDRIGERFNNLLQASKTLPRKILFNLKESATSARDSQSGGISNAEYSAGTGVPGTFGTPDDKSITSGIARLFSSSPDNNMASLKFGLGPQKDSLGSAGPGSAQIGGSSTGGGSNTPQYTESSRMPAFGTNAGGSGPGTSPAPLPRPRTVVPEHRMNKFYKLLSAAVIDLDALQELCWNGIPSELRPACWRLLLGYMPPNKSQQAATLGRKRQEYYDMVPTYYDISNSERSEEELGALRQVILDVPRTAPTIPFFHEPFIQKSLERLLYIWGIRHPASGYVQGMNDLVTPFLAIFLGEHLTGHIESWSPDQLNEEMLLQVEADCYWCLCKLVEAIQDHYTYAQPGIQRTVFRIHEVVRSAAPPLAQQLEGENIDFIQFAWRWVNCLLIREVPFELSFRLWDTYLSEGCHRFAEFLVYACAAFLVMWQRELEHMEFQDMIMFLQKPPTGEWHEAQLEAVLGQAFILRNQYSAAHLRSK